MKRKSLKKIITLALFLTMIFSTVASAKTIYKSKNSQSSYKCIDPFPMETDSAK